MTEKAKHQSVQRLIIAIAAMIIGLALWMGWDYLTSFLSFFKDKEAISYYLAQLGLWGPVLYVLVLGAQVISVVIPGHALMVTAGYLYGFKIGLLLNFLGAIGASQLAFLISRRTGQGFVRKIVPAKVLSSWEDIVKRQGIFFFMVCFWFPVIPSNATNYMAGLSSVSFLAFFAANVTGRLPGLIMVTLIGAYGLELSIYQWTLTALVGIIVVVAGRIVTSKFEHRYFPSPSSP